MYVNRSLKVPLLDAIDRLSIIELKRERLRNETDRLAVENEHTFYTGVLDSYRAEGLIVRDEWVADMKNVNARLWDVEARIRTAQDDHLSLEDIGGLAVQLRDLNDERTKKRSAMAAQINIDTLAFGDAPTRDTRFKLPFHEAIDRLTILMLKRERLPHDDLTEKEYTFYEAVVHAYRADGVEIPPAWITQMKAINGRIWDIEGAIRQKREGEFGLEEMGRRTLALRHIGAERVSFKKKIAEVVQSDFYEVKI